jgi:hypothetical protein
VVVRLQRHLADAGVFSGSGLMATFKLPGGDIDLKVVGAWWNLVEVGDIEAPKVFRQ